MEFSFKNTFKDRICSTFVLLIMIFTVLHQCMICTNKKPYIYIFRFAVRIHQRNMSTLNYTLQGGLKRAELVDNAIITHVDSLYA